MLNFEKIRLMTRLTVYEKGLGIEDEKIAKYFRNDYVFGALIGSFAAGTVAWGICAALYCGYFFEQIFFSVYENKLGPTIRFAVTSYAVFILFFLLVTRLVYRFRNQGYMERRYYYEQDRDTLLGMYEKEQEQMRNWIRKNG